MMTSCWPKPGRLRKNAKSSTGLLLPSCTRAGNRLGTTLTSHGASGSVRGILNNSLGVLLSLPGQNGQPESHSGNSLTGILLASVCGRLPLSGARMTHSLVVGSCLNSDITFILFEQGSDDAGWSHHFLFRDWGNHLPSPHKKQCNCAPF